MASYDVAVIGAGVCGLQAAFKAVVRGQETAIIEKERLGGTCLTRGCIPTKAMVRSAEVAHLADRGAEFGIEIDGEIQADMAKIVERKDRIVDQIEEVNEQDIQETDALDLYRGSAQFVDEHTLRVGDQEEVQADEIVIATGARPRIPDWPGVDEVDFVTSRGVLDLEVVPEHLIVVGGGYIGIESAQMIARFGADVTILQRSTLLKEEDREIVEVLIEELENDGIDVREGTSVRRLAQEGETIRVHTDDPEGEARVVEGDALLLAVGRVPNAPSLDLAKAGVKTWGPGWIDVDERMCSSTDHIWAVGDAIGEQLFTHVGRYEVEVMIENMLEQGETRVDYHAAPYAVFSDPELGRVGMTLAEAREAGYEAEETAFTFEHLGKALCLGEQEGLIKVVAEAGSGELLGFHVLAHGGAELVHEAVVQMHNRGTVDDLADAMHIHPTMAEGVNDAAFQMATELGRRRF